MYHALIKYRDLGGVEGYAILAMLSESVTEEAMTAYDPKRRVSLRVDQLVECRQILDISKPCERDWPQVLELTVGMPDTLYQLEVLNTVCDI